LTETISPRRTISRAIELSASPEWIGTPEPNSGVRFKLEAILEIRPTPNADVRGVWTGKISSEPVETLFVNPRLNTPHEYLRAKCPRQALRVLQGDPAWVGKADENRRTPLHHAVELGFIDVVRWLLEHGANVDAVADHDTTPLHLASDPSIVAVLLKSNPNLNRRGGSWNETPLLTNAGILSRLTDKDDEAQASKYKRITELLLSAGADYDIDSAIYLNDIARVREILKGDPAVVKEFRGAQVLPLGLAAREGHAEICNLLIDQHADPNERELWCDFPVLFHALQHPEVVKLLLDAGASANVRLGLPAGMRTYHVGDRATLLHYVAGEGAVESARLLLERNVPINAVDDRRITPLHIAAMCRDPAMVRFLLSRGADVNAKDWRGLTPLDSAEKYGNKAAAEVLREHKSKE
jgi:ankyrin repeat protein